MPKLIRLELVTVTDDMIWRCLDTLQTRYGWLVDTFWCIWHGFEHYQERFAAILHSCTQKTFEEHKGILKPWCQGASSKSQNSFTWWVHTDMVLEPFASRCKLFLTSCTPCVARTSVCWKWLLGLLGAYRHHIFLGKYYCTLIFCWKTPFRSFFPTMTVIVRPFPPSKSSDLLRCQPLQERGTGQNLGVGQGRLWSCGLDQLLCSSSGLQGTKVTTSHDFGDPGQLEWRGEKICQGWTNLYCQGEGFRFTHGFTRVFYRCWMKKWVRLLGKMVMCGDITIAKWFDGSIDDFMYQEGLGKVCILASTSDSWGFMLLSRSSKITIKTATWKNGQMEFLRRRWQRIGRLIQCLRSSCVWVCRHRLGLDQHE